MGFDLGGSTALAAQPLLGIFSQKLQDNKLLKQESGGRAGGRAENWAAFKGKSDESGNNIQSPSQVAQLILTV